jgi:hypothetical protein
MIDKQEPSVAVEDAHPLQSERRRPGRIARVSSALIPLLRGTTVPEEREQNDLAPATGIAVSALISGLIWAILVWIV